MGNEEALPIAKLDAELTCPHCQAVEKLRMPTDYCMWFHQCSSCDAMLSPLPGDCCVFCSFADLKCPPVQLGNCCG